MEPTKLAELKSCTRGALVSGLCFTTHRRVEGVFDFYDYQNWMPVAHIVGLDEMEHGILFEETMEEDPSNVLQREQLIVARARLKETEGGRV